MLSATVAAMLKGLKGYETDAVLGSGASAQVLRGKELSSGKFFAIKVMKRPTKKDKIALLEDELSILRSIKHDNVTQLHEVQETANVVFMVMQLATGGELFDRVIQKGSYSERDASGLLRQLLHGVAYLHSQHIVHRDLKPENLLFADAREEAPLLITDFGLATRATGNTLTYTCGTPGYVAPEMALNQPYGSGVDCWAVGVICYILLCGFPPFYEETTHDLLESIKVGSFPFDSPDWDPISDSAKDLIRHFLTKPVDKRYTCDDGLKHPWIAGGAATTSDILATVATNFKEYRAKKNWKRLFHVEAAIKRMAMAHKLTQAAKAAAQGAAAESDDGDDDEDAIGAASLEASS